MRGSCIWFLTFCSRTWSEGQPVPFLLQWSEPFGHIAACLQDDLTKVIDQQNTPQFWWCMTNVSLYCNDLNVLSHALQRPDTVTSKGWNDITEIKYPQKLI